MIMEKHYKGPQYHFKVIMSIKVIRVLVETGHHPMNSMEKIIPR